MNIEQIKADREAGTLDSAAYGDETNVAMVGVPNAVNRVARINDYEAALVEAMGLIEDLHDQLSAATHIEEETFLALQSFLKKYAKPD